MRRTRFDDWPCPIARTTDLFGDWWTPLVLRECFRGRRRFDEFVAALGIPRPVLSQRLGRLVDEGLLVKRPYEEHPPRWEYRGGSCLAAAAARRSPQMKRLRVSFRWIMTRICVPWSGDR